jgi:hypothetical protein
MKTCGEWKYSSTIIDLGTRWKWVVSFMPLPLYPWGNNPQYPLDRRLVRPKSWSELYGEEKNLALSRNRTLAVECMQEWRYSSTILNFGTGRRWVVSFTPWPLYPLGKSHRYPLDRRLSGPQSLCGFTGEEKNPLSLLGIKPWPSSP